MTLPAPGPSRARRWLSGFRERETWTAYLFLLPWVIGFLIFTLGPMIYSLHYSFTDYGLGQIAGLDKTHSVGFDNYKQLWDDPKVAESLKNTFIYTVMMVPAKVIVALVLAMMLMRIKRVAGFFRTIFYLPHMTPPVAVGVLIIFLFNGQVGIVTHVFQWFGFHGPYWTVDPNWIKPTIAIMDVWACGGTMVILLAALHGVPRQLYEAAEMDGAPAWRRFKDVTLPMISPALFFCIIILTLAGLTNFAQIYTAYFGTGGYVGQQPEAALMFSIYLFRKAFVDFQMGYASALAWVLFGITMGITLVQIVVGRRLVFYQGGRR